VKRSSSQLDDLADFYLGGGNLFQIWERGGARGDSVTPSTYCAEYRHWMQDKIVKHLERSENPQLLSLGCGNAAVESEVAAKGYRVLCVDAIQEAVDLARVKGLRALRADITTWTPDEPCSVAYMDGVLGHLYRPETGLVPILSRVRSWLQSADPSHGTLIASNDSPGNGQPAESAAGVIGFHWLSASYLCDQVLLAGFGSISSETFIYERPLSGTRARSVVVARLR